MDGKELYEVWNELWVTETGAESRPHSQMVSEDPRESCMWEDLASKVIPVDDLASDEVYYLLGDQVGHATASKVQAILSERYKETS